MTTEAVVPTESKKDDAETIHKDSDDEIRLDSLPKLEVRKRDDTLNQMEFITKRAIALHLKSMGMDFSTQALEELYDLFTLNIQTTLRDLQTITYTQRRLKSSPQDLKVLLQEYHIRIGELEQELKRCRKNQTEDLIKKKKALEEIAINANNSEGDLIDAHDPSYVFFAHDDDIMKLIPPSHKRSKSILPWLPQFPPDHTYLRTPKYTDRITDPKVVRTKIAEESRLGEKALDGLISYEAKIESVDFETIEIEKDDDVIDRSHEKKTVDVEDDGFNIWTQGLEKRLDIERYAKARLKYIENKRLKQENKSKKSKDPYLQLIANYSPFAPDDDVQQNGITPEKYIKRQLKTVMNSLSALKEQKQQREVERKRLQEEKRQQLETLKRTRDELDDFDNFDDDGFQNFDDFDNFGHTKTAADFDFGLNGKDEDGDIDLIEHTQKGEIEQPEQQHQQTQTSDAIQAVTMPESSEITTEDVHMDISNAEGPESITRDATADLRSNSQTPILPTDESIPSTIEHSIQIVGDDIAEGGNNNDEEEDDDDDDLFDEVPLV